MLKALHMDGVEKHNKEKPLYFRDTQGKAFFSFAFVIYGLLICVMLLSAAFMNLMTEDWARPALNTLQRIIPLIYIPAVILFFMKVRVYIICLAAAYAYDLWFHFYVGLTAAQLIIDYPLWTACALLTIIFGFAYRGFRFRWRLFPRRESRNGFIDT